MFADKPIEYLDTTGAKVLSAKLVSYSMAKVYGPDGKSLAATVEKMKPLSFEATCTFAKGVDPIIALAMANQALSMSG